MQKCCEVLASSFDRDGMDAHVKFGVHENGMRKHVNWTLETHNLNYRIYVVYPR